MQEFGANATAPSNFSKKWQTMHALWKKAILLCTKVRLTVKLSLITHKHSLEQQAPNPNPQARSGDLRRPSPAQHLLFLTAADHPRNMHWAAASAQTHLETKGSASGSLAQVSGVTAWQEKFVPRKFFLTQQFVVWRSQPQRNEENLKILERSLFPITSEFIVYLHFCRD